MIFTALQEEVLMKKVLDTYSSKNDINIKQIVAYKDWLALLAVLIFNAVIGILIVEIMVWRIKKIPISLGVIQ